MLKILLLFLHDEFCDDAEVKSHAFFAKFAPNVVNRNKYATIYVS